MEEFQDLLAQYLDKFVNWIPSLIAAILVLLIGFFIVKRIMRLLERYIQKANIDREIQEFLVSIMDIVLKIAVILTAATFVGFKMSAIIGLLAATGFAIGLALQGFLGNFASGLTIVFFKPYKIGDWVEISDKFGKVESIKIFHTELSTPNNKRLIVPNGQVTDNIITNFSNLGYIKLEIELLVAYQESIPKLKDIIIQSLQNSPFILQDKATVVGIKSYDTHNVVLAVKPSIHPDHYWPALYDTNARIKDAFHKNNIQMAYSEGIELGPIGP